MATWRFNWVSMGVVHLAHAPFAKPGDDLVRPDSRRRSCVASRGSAAADWREGHQGGGDYSAPGTIDDFTVEA